MEHQQLTPPTLERERKGGEVGGNTSVESATCNFTFLIEVN